MPPRRYTYHISGGFEVWGKEYQDAAGVVTWQLRVFSDQDRKIETYDAVKPDRPPTGTRLGEGEAMRDALAAWSQQD